MTEAKQNQNPVLEELSQLRARVVELEQRLAQTEAHSSQVTSDRQLYQTLLENLPNGFIFVFDHDLRYLVVVGSGLPTPKETMEGKLLQDLVSPQGYALISRHYRLALQGQENFFELNFAEKTLLTRVRPLRDKQGNIFAGIAMVQDITEQKRAEEQLRQNEKRYRAVSEMTSDFVWAATVTPSGSFQLAWVTDAVENVTGYSAVEFAELGGVGGICLAEDLPNLLKIRMLVFSQEQKKAEFECRIRCKDQQIRWLHIIGLPLLEDGKVAGLLAAAKDVTEQKRAAEQLLQSEARYRIVSEMTSDFVWAGRASRGGQFKLNWATDAVERITGYSLAEFEAGKGLSSLIVPEDKAGFADWSKQFCDGKTQNAELVCRIQRKDKQIRWLQLAARLVASDGVAQDFIVAAKDITENKQIEAEKQNLEQQRQIVQKLESLGVLAGGIAHDFNNLLAVILGNLSLALNTLDNPSTDPEVIDSLQEAAKASQRAIGLTHQLLTFAKGGAPIRKTAQLGEIIEDSARFMVSGSRATLDFEIAPDLAAAEVDTNQLSQVIQNLVLNAVQAMPNGGKIRLTAHNVTLRSGEVATLPAGPYVQIRIQDEGVGISPENQAKIFDPFFTTKSAGSGLGLAMVFSIIRQHDGYIQVESIPGDGTCFTFYLPASKSNQLAAKPTVCAPVPATQPKRNRVLLMDDEASIRQTVHRLLTHLGYSCEVAADGIEAIRLYREALANKCPYSAVILDLTVRNGMGGEEAVRQILKNDPQARVIVSSGYSEDPIMANFSKYGFSGTVKKPYVMGELQQVLQEVISKTR